MAKDQDLTGIVIIGGFIIFMIGYAIWTNFMYGDELDAYEATMNQTAQELGIETESLLGPTENKTTFKLDGQDGPFTPKSILVPQANDIVSLEWKYSDCAIWQKIPAIRVLKPDGDSAQIISPKKVKLWDRMSMNSCGSTNPKLEIAIESPNVQPHLATIQTSGGVVAKAIPNTTYGIFSKRQIGKDGRLHDTFNYSTVGLRQFKIQILVNPPSDPPPYIPRGFSRTVK